MAKQITIDELEKYLWDAAIDLRGQIDAAAYKDYIFPLVFFKRICDVYDEEYDMYKEQGGEAFAKEMMQESSIKIPEGAHWKNVFNTTENIGQKLVDTFRSIEHVNQATEIDGRFVGGLEGIFGDKSIWTNKSKMPDNIIRNLLNNFNKLTLSIAACPADEMGTGYEYLIGQFADDAGHTAQEFYTNRTVVELMAEILKLQPHESIYDPTCGSGGMLIKSLTYLKDKGEEWRDVKVYGQEINSGTASIARMNLFLHGIHDFSIVNADTLENPAFIKGGKVQQFNVVLANPPYSISAWNREKFEHDVYERNIWGTPTGIADYAFFQHIVSSLDDNTGRCAILFPHGVLGRYAEYEMRKRLIESDILDCIIGIADNLFFNSAMEACVIVCRKKKENNRKEKVLFINARHLVKRGSSKKDTFLGKEHIDRIVSLYNKYEDYSNIAKVASIQDIRDNDYKLNINLYSRGYSSCSNNSDDVSTDALQSQLLKCNDNAKQSLIYLSQIIGIEL